MRWPEHPDLAAFRALAALPDGAARARTPAHLTASAAVLDPTGCFTLLVLHRKVRRWLQPGGHVESGDASLAAAALREAQEETGTYGLVIDPEPVHLDRHPAPCAAEEHLDVQFLIRAPALVVPQVSAESLDVRWWPVDALPEPAALLGPLLAAARARHAP